MGNYRRTIYCRWCSQQGHNRRTCPELTVTAKERAESEVEDNKNRAEGEENYYYLQKEYAKRIKADKLLDGTPYSRGKQSNGTSQRRCSYCAAKGHNRRTCLHFVGAKQGYVEEAIQYRKDMADTLPAMGVGVGTLVTIRSQHSNHHDPDRNYLYMVVGFEWDTITHKTGVDAYRCIELKSLDGGNLYNEHLPFPKPSNHVNDPDLDSWQQKYESTERYWESVVVVSKSSEGDVKKVIPSNWYEPKSIEKGQHFKNYFKEVRSPDYWDNYYT